VRVSVAEQQGDLEEEHAGDPDGRRTAEPGQNQLGDHRLYLEQQERTEENGYRIESEGAGRDWLGGCGGGIGFGGRRIHGTDAAL